MKLTNFRCYFDGEASGGVKTLILMSQDSDHVFNASAYGDNCAKWIFKIAEELNKNRIDWELRLSKLENRIIFIDVPTSVTEETSLYADSTKYMS